PPFFAAGPPPPRRRAALLSATPPFFAAGPPPPVHPHPAVSCDITGNGCCEGRFVMVCRARLCENRARLCEKSAQAGWRAALEVAAAALLPLDRLEQRLAVALAEALRAVPLDQLEKHRRPVLHRLGEHLQQVTILVPVGEDLLGGQFGERHAGLADPGAEL